MHSLNAYAYYKRILEERGLDYDITDPASINKLADEAKDLRQEGKSKTFAMNYLAGASTVGAEEYDNYWTLYETLHKFNNSIIKTATRQGYLISAYSGLRLKLSSINSNVEKDANKEQRVAVNFSTQSGNILMLKTIDKEQEYLEEHDKLEDIIFCNTVHDSQYFYIKKKASVVKLANDTFIKIMTEDYMENQIVPLEAEMEIGNNMIETVKLPNNIEKEEMLKIMKEGLTK